MKHYLSIVLFVVGLALSTAVWAQAVQTEAVDINTADAQTIAQVMKGVGPAKATAIVTYREENGPFASVYDLTKVRGIGAKTVEANLDVITVD